MSRPFVQKLLDNSFIRKISTKVHYELMKYEDAEATKMLSPDRKVLGGIFKGMTYPDYQSSGSPLFSKLLGTYEEELDPFFENIPVNKYAEIIDIGCAEGYYAVGLSMHHPKSKIYAYDIDQDALDRCKAMALLNKVDSNITFGHKCDKETLRDFKSAGKALIICDCEGYEAELFDTEIAKVLSGCDFVIELHDMVVPHIKAIIQKAFENTHEIKYIQSTLKCIKDYPIAAKLPIAYQNDRFTVDRTTRMEWAIITSK